MTKVSKVRLGWVMDAGVPGVYESDVYFTLRATPAATSLEGLRAACRLLRSVLKVEQI